MARINLVNPKILTDKHLIEEYRDLPMILNYLRRTLDSREGITLKKIRKHCPLGTGHIYFFYDKLTYLKKRYLLLVTEMNRRNIKVTKHRCFNFDGLPPRLYNDYCPSKAEMDLMKKRLMSLIKRGQAKHKYGGRILNDYYFDFFIRN